MSSSSHLRKLESLLPARNLTLKALLEEYGKWWCTLPSNSIYSRYFATDGQHFLVVWEGYPGSYDYFGDFADDAHFYNAVVKGEYYFYRISEYSYESLYALRSAMISEWGEGLETAYHQGVAQHEFTRTFMPRVYKLLRQTAEQWMLRDEFRQHRFEISVNDQSTYLSIWTGDANIFKSDEFAEYDGPKIRRTPSMRYAELCIRVMCVPHRIALLDRRSLDADWFAPTYREWQTVTGSEIDELKNTIEIAMNHLTWHSR